MYDTILTNMGIMPNKNQWEFFEIAYKRICFHNQKHIFIFKEIQKLCVIQDTVNHQSLQG